MRNKEQVPTMSIGQHQHVQKMPHFRAQDPREERVEGVFCHDCQAWKPTVAELRRTPCSR